MNKIHGLILATGALMIAPNAAWSQVINELNPDTIEGASINSNSDDSFGEHFVVNDSSIQVFRADGDVETNVGNANDVTIDYDSDNAGGGTFALRSGGAAVLSADNAGAITIANGATLNNTLDVDSNGGTAGGTRLSISGASATMTSTDSNTTSTLSNSGHVLAHVDGTATNSIAIGQTQQATIGTNSFDYGTTILGGALVQGDLGVNGSIYALNPTANTGINVGNNGLEVNGGTNTTSLVADSNGTANDGRGVLTLQEDQASMVVYNQQTGQAHGLTVNQTSTVLSGGTTSTTLTLSDSGAAFANTDTGGPAHVTGVADGYSRYDAVNFGQLREAYGGIAAIAAMANIPAPPAGKEFSVGLGFGNFEGENAFALGGVARLTDNVSVQASIGRSDDNSSFGAGVGFSW